MSAPVLVTKASDGVSHITLRRSARPNAFNAELAAALIDASHAVAADTSSRAVVLTWRGVASAQASI